MELIEKRIKKVINPHSLVFLIQRDCHQETDFSIDILLFLLRYSFLLTDTPQDNYFLKRDFPLPGELFSQNSNGARYLDPKYSRWISTELALGEYVPAAGKGKASDASNLPGMGGIYNSVNGNLYHYAGNNPIRYVNPDGREDEIVSKKEMWIAKEYFLSFGVDERIGDKGLTETYDIDPEGWKGISRGLSVSIGGPISYGIQFSVYRDPSKLQNDFSDHPEWFPWKNQNQLWLTRGQGNVKK